MCHAALISPLSGCGPGHVVQVDGRLRGRVDSLYALWGISLYSEYRTLAHNEGSLFLDSSRSFFFYEDSPYVFSGTRPAMLKFALAACRL